MAELDFHWFFIFALRRWMPRNFGEKRPRKSTNAKRSARERKLNQHRDDTITRCIVIVVQFNLLLAAGCLSNVVFFPFFLQHVAKTGWTEKEKWKKKSSSRQIDEINQFCKIMYSSSKSYWQHLIWEETYLSEICWYHSDCSSLGVSFYILIRRAAKEGGAKKRENDDKTAEWSEDKSNDKLCISKRRQQ